MKSIHWIYKSYVYIKNQVGTTFSMYQVNMVDVFRVDRGGGGGRPYITYKMALTAPYIALRKRSLRSH